MAATSHHSCVRGDELSHALIHTDKHADRSHGIPIPAMVVIDDVMAVGIVLIPIAVVVAAVVMTRIPLAIGPKIGRARQNKEGRHSRQHDFVN